MMRLAFVALLGTLHLAGSASSQESAAAIEVRLVDEAGAPIDRARVVAMPGLAYVRQHEEWDNEVIEARGLGAGRFALDELPPAGGWRVYAFGGAFVPVRSRVLTLGPAERLSLELVAERGAALRGRITNTRGRPIAGVSVRVRPWMTWSFRWPRRDQPLDWLLEPRLEVETDAAGGFEIRGLERGPYRVEVRHPTYCQRAEQIVVEQDELRALDLALLRGARIRGLVRDAQGGPVAGAHVSWDLDAGPDEVDRAVEGISTHTDNAGRFEFACLESRFYSARLRCGWRIEAPGYVETEHAFVLPPSDPIEVTLERATPVVEAEAEPPSAPSPAEELLGGTGALRGRVFSASGAALGSAVIGIRGEQGRRCTRADADGRYAFDRLPAGDYDVRVLPSDAPALDVIYDFCRRAREVPVAEEETTLLDVVAPDVTPLDLRARIRFPDGTPLVHGVVHVLPCEPEEDFEVGGEGRTTTTGLDGRFLVRDLIPGKHFLAVFDVSEPRRSFELHIDLSPTAPRELELVLSTARIDGVVLGPDDRPLEDVNVWYRPVPRRPWSKLQRLTDLPWDRAVSTDRHGRFAFDGLLPGEYSLRAGNDSGILYVARTRVAVQLASPTARESIEMRVEYAGWRSVELLGEDGRRITDARLVLHRRPGSNWSYDFWSTDDGTYEITGPAGEAEVLLLHEDYAARLQRVVLLREPAPFVSIPVRRGAALSFLSRDEAGRSMAFCRLEVEVDGMLGADLAERSRMHRFVEDQLPWPLRSDREGILVRKDLPVGPARVRMTRGSQSSDWTEIEVPAEGSRDIVLTLR